MQTRRKTGVVERASEVGLLASPVRQEIVDTLEALGGEASVAAMAAHLGRPSDGLYYHLRLLARGGLVDEMPDAGQGRRYRTAVRKGSRLRLKYRPGKTPNAAAVERVAAGMLRTARRDFAAAIHDPEVAVEGPARALWASRAKGWVSDSGRIEINRLLERALALLQRGKRPRGARLMSLTWIVAPVEARPARRQ